MNRHEHGHRHHDEAMLSVEDALERILDHFHVLDAEEVPLLEALGQVLAEDAVSLHDIPPLDNSAMDGYAVQASSIGRRRRKTRPSRSGWSAQWPRANCLTRRSNPERRSG